MPLSSRLLAPERWSWRRLFLLALAGSLLFPIWFPLWPYADQAPPLDVLRFTPSPLAGLAYAGLLGGLFLVYGAAARRQREQPMGVARVLATAALLALPLLLTYPINATDVFRYFLRGRVAAVYRQNPYTTAPANFPSDPYLPLGGEWSAETSPYGPVWELVARGITRLAPQALLPALLLFKGLGLLLHLAAAAIIWRIARQHQAGRDARAGPWSPETLALLWAWNPALWLTFVANGHNDALWLVLLLAAALAAGVGGPSRRRPRGWLPVLGCWLAVAAALVKPIALLAVPFVWLAAGRRRPRGWTILRFGAVVAGGSLLLGWAAFRPFGSPLSLAARLLSEAAGAGGFSPVALLALVGRRLDPDFPVASLVVAGQAFFSLLAAGLLWPAWRGRALWTSLGYVFLAYLLTAFSFRIWYAAWPFPWLVLHARRTGRPAAVRLGMAMLVTSQLSVLVYAHLRVYVLGGDQLWAHLIGVPFTFGLPLMLAWRARDRSWPSDADPAPG